MPTLTIDWERSPRIIIVEQPDTEISAQQIVDLCRDAEDEPDNTGYPKLLNASGKEDLGGGTSVGITVEMQNAKIGFDDRTNKLETGTVTTPDTTGVTLTDSTALFETNLVEIGDLVVNTTDGSHSTVIDVTSETSVLTTGLAGGTDNQFASADAYEVWEIIPCEITGGNVVAVDDVGADLDPLLPTFGVYAKVSKASTGTLSEQGDIQHASYDGSVHVDVTSGISGSNYPAGNSANPVDNWPDAVIINAREGFDQYSVEKSTTLDATQDYTDATFVGKSIIDTVLTIPAGTTLDKAEFFNVSLEGSLGDVTIMQNCFLGETNELTDVQGVIEDCSIGPAKLTLGGTSVDLVRFVDCRGAGSNFSPPTINCGGDGPEVDIQGYVGQLNIENKTGESVFEISITGKLTLDSTVTSGTIIVNGAGTLDDNTGTGVTVINNMIQGIHLSELWKIQGLEFGNPMTVTKSDRTVADQSVSLALSGDGVTSTTVTRQTDQTISFDAPLVSDLVDLSDTAANATFSRSSTGSYVDSSTGLITSAAIDVPRFELEGLLLEEARINIMGWSEDITVAPWTNVRSLEDANATTAPDGNVTADRFKDDNGGGSNTCVVLENRIMALSTVYTMSIFAKKDTLDWTRLQISGLGSKNITAYFDLTNGVVGTTLGTDNISEGIEAYGDGWFRCSITFLSDAVDTSGNFAVYLAEADGDSSVPRDNTSSIFLWGAQLEVGSFASSYIATDATSKSRDADFLSYDEDSVVFDAAGSILCDITPNYGSDMANDGVVVNVANILDGPLYVTDDTTQKIAIGDGSLVSSFDPSLIEYETVTIASRWSGSTMQTIAGGSSGTAATYDGAFVRSAGTLYVGSGATGNHINGNIKNLRVYNVDRGENQLLVDTA